MSVDGHMGVDRRSETSGAGSLARGARMANVRDRMRELDVDALLLSLGADLPWLTGYEAMPLERLTMLVLPVDDQATLVVPELEAPRVDHDPRPVRDASLGRARAGKRGRDGSGRPADTPCSLGPMLGAHLLELERIDADGAMAHGERGCRALAGGEGLYEVEVLRAAGAAADRVANALLDGEISLIGKTEAEVSADISRRLLSEGHDRVNFAIVGSGPIPPARITIPANGSSVAARQSCVISAAL